MSYTMRNLPELVDAGFSGLWIETHEPDEALRELWAMAHDRDWRMLTWDVAAGLATQPGQGNGDDNPLTPLKALESVGGPNRPTAVLVLPNYHRFVGNTLVLQTLCNTLVAGKPLGTFVIVLAPTVQIPVELEKLFVVVEHELPDAAALMEIASGVGQDSELPENPANWERLMNASAGLTRSEAEGAFSLSIIRQQRMDAETVWELKTAALQKSGLLTLHGGTEDFSQLGGLERLKDFTLRSLVNHPAGVNPKGVLLVSPPGCGKSAFCKALGRETGRPVLILDVGALMGSLVGQSEERTRQALKLIDAMSPCVVMIDEVEKAFAGASGNGALDSGVSSRMFGTFLTWLNDHTSDAYVVCTSNDVSRLPPEFARAERFDGLFMVDLPTREEKDVIWRMYCDQYAIACPQRPVDENWTGAEIKACCRMAALLGVPLLEAADNVVPVSVTAADRIEALRTWASGRCLHASRRGFYQKPTADTGNGRRRVNRASQN